MAMGAVRTRCLHVGVCKWLELVHEATLVTGMREGRETIENLFDRRGRKVLKQNT